MKRQFNYYLLGFCVALSGPEAVLAHPVTFKDGWALQTSVMPKRQDFEINHSLSNREALGLSYHRIDDGEEKNLFVLPQFNFLLRRWNDAEYQANIYLMAGAGVRSRDDEESFAAKGAFQGDFETRTFYTALMGESLLSESGHNFNRLSYRAGLSPYKAAFDELTTWIVLQTTYQPDMEEEYEITPLLRFFYKNYLWEIGSSVEGDVYLQAMVHF